MPLAVPFGLYTAVEAYCDVVVDARKLVFPPGLNRLMPYCSALLRSTSSIRTFSLTCFGWSGETVSAFATSFEYSPASFTAVSASASLPTLPLRVTRSPLPSMLTASPCIASDMALRRPATSRSEDTTYDCACPASSRITSELIPETIAVTTIWFGLSVTELSMLGSDRYTRRRRLRVFRNRECPTVTWSISAPDVTRLMLPEAPGMGDAAILETAATSETAAACAAQATDSATVVSTAAAAATPARAIVNAGFLGSLYILCLTGNRPSSVLCPGWSQPNKS